MTGNCARPFLLAALAVVLIASMIVAVALGAVPVPLKTVAGVVVAQVAPGAIEHTWPPGEERIVWDIRVPRAILAALVGAGLAVVGATLQAITRNPLADPYLFGISSGAALGAVAVIVHLGLFLGPATLPLAAFVGAMAALLMVLAIAGRRRPDSERLLLAGVAVSFVFAAATNFLIFAGDPRAAHSVVFWMLGGLGLARWSLLVVPAAVAILGILVLVLHGRVLNALASGDETAASLGVEVASVRLRLFAISAVVTGALVAVSGAIGFVGLIVPHLVRAAVGADYRRVLPVAALAGALFIVWADVAARLLLVPQELPIGMITAALGGGFFAWHMARRP